MSNHPRSRNGGLLLVLAQLILQLAQAPLSEAAKRKPACGPQYARLDATGAVTSAVKKYLASYSPYFYSDGPPPVGIETEAALRESVHYQGMGQLLRERLLADQPDSNPKFTLFWDRSRGPSNQVIGGGQLTYSLESRPLTVTLKRDGTVNTLPDEIPLELISDKLARDSQMESFLGLIEYTGGSGAARAGAEVGGVHVHVGFPDPRPGEVGLLSQIWSRIDQEIRRTMNVEGKRRGMFVLPFNATESRRLNSGELLDELPRARKAGKSTAQDELPKDVEVMIDRLRNGVPVDRRRFSALNLESLKKHGTVEFRLMNSTFSTPAIRGFAVFSRALVMAVRTKRHQLTEYLSSVPDSEPLDLLKLMQAIGIQDKDAQEYLKAWSST